MNIRKNDDVDEKRYYASYMYHKLLIAKKMRRQQYSEILKSTYTDFVIHAGLYDAIMNIESF